MTNQNIHKPSLDIIQNAHIDSDNYEKMYEESITNPDVFWNTHGKRIDWIKPYTKISNVS